MNYIFLDSSPLGLLSNPAKTGEVAAITAWAADCLSAGHEIYLPEVTDYELRRELLRAGKTAGISELDWLKTQFRYIPISTKAMLTAAELWAMSRQSGRPTADPHHLDVDVILAAQALTCGEPLSDILVATSNVAHLSQFIAAKRWTDIVP
jgi:predicted nucleic acid-binding protein